MKYVRRVAVALAISLLSFGSLSTGVTTASGDTSWDYVIVKG